VPVITTESRLHAPEFGYLTHGQNGLVAGSMDELPAVLASFLAAPELQLGLAAGALAARDSLSIEEMARCFDRGVRSVLEGRSRANRPLTR
jgi:hypothetical protein